MSSTSQERRLILKLAAIATPALAVAAWLGNGERRGLVTSNGKFRFFSAADGIHWASAVGARGGLFLPLGMSFALTSGSIAPDDRYLAYSALDRRTGSNIWIAPIYLHDERPIAGPPAAFFHSGAFDVNPRFSEDGRQLAYASREAGIWNTRARRFV